MTMNIVFDATMITIPISEHFREFALNFAQEQPNPHRQRQVYLNTLSVQVVNYYLQLLEVETDLEASDSWNPYIRLIDDVADLMIPGLGKLECRGLIADSEIYLSHQSVVIPPEVWENRVGYIFVAIDGCCSEAKILGFLNKLAELDINLERETIEVSLSQIQPVTDLIDHLYDYLYNAHLRQWLEGIYAQKWVSMEDFAGQSNRELAFRSRRVLGIELSSSENAWKVIEQLYPVSTWQRLLPADLASQALELRNQQQTQRLSSLKTTAGENAAEVLLVRNVITSLLSRTHEDEETRWTLAEVLWTIDPNHPTVSARRITDLGMQITGYPVALMVAILSVSPENVSVLVRVYPTGNQPYLPPGLKLAVIDQQGEELLQVQASIHKDDFIQLKFGAEFNERFRVQVGIDDFSITENFVV